MKRKPYPVTNLTGGLNVSLDALLLEDSTSPNLTHVRYVKGILTKDVGLSSYGSVAERPMLLYNFKLYSGSVVPICFTVDQMYTYANGNYANVANSNVFTGNEDNAFSVTPFMDKLYITNGKDAIKVYDGANLANWTAANGYYAKQLITFHNCLFMMNCNEGGNTLPHRVRWTGIADANDLTSNLAGAFDLLDTPDHIVGAVIIGDRLFVVKERSIWEVYYTGTVGQIFNARLIHEGIGSLSPQSILPLGAKAGMFGIDSFYLFDGNNFEDEGEALRSLIYDTEFNIVHTQKLNRAPAIYLDETREYIIVVPTKTSDPDWMLRFNTKSKEWLARDQSAVCLGTKILSTRLTWTAANGSNWSNAIWDRPWRQDQLPPGAATLLLGMANGVIYEDNRLTKSNDLMVWESKDFLLSHEQRWVEVRYQVKGDPFDVSYSTDGGKSWSIERTLTPEGVDKFYNVIDYINFTSTKLRVRIRTRNEEFQMEWFEPWYIERPVR